MRVHEGSWGFMRILFAWHHTNWITNHTHEQFKFQITFQAQSPEILYSDSSYWKGIEYRLKLRLALVSIGHPSLRDRGGHIGPCPTCTALRRPWWPHCGRHRMRCPRCLYLSVIQSLAVGRKACRFIQSIRLSAFTTSKRIQMSITIIQLINLPGRLMITNLF